MNTFRKGFYAFDILMVLIVIATIAHAAVITSYPEILLLDVSVLLRFNTSILLYRRERWSVAPIVVFTVLFGIAYTCGLFDNAIFRTAELLGIMLGNYVNMKFVLNLIFIWMWFAPVAVYAFQAVRRKLVGNDYRWYDIAGLAIFKDRVGIQLVAIGVLTFAAYIMGYSLDLTVTKYSVLAIPLVAYWMVNRFICRKPHWAEYLMLFVALFIFGKAQFKFDNERIIYLAISAVIVFAVCVFMLIKTKKPFATLLALVLLAVLPALSLGYNVYCCTDGARGQDYKARFCNSKYMYLHRTDMIDGEAVYSFGLRDRYREVIPCKYRFIAPSSPYSSFFNCITETGDTVVHYIETGEVIDKDELR